MLEPRRLYRGVVRRAVPRLFPLLERAGVHVAVNDFNSPIPDTRGLDAYYPHKSSLAGIDWRADAQLALVERLGAFRDEMQWPWEPTADPRVYYRHNGRFADLDARLLWGVVRDAKPKRIVEVGSGYSTVLAAAALRANRADGHPGELLAIEPYPAPFLDPAFLEVVTLQPVPVEQVPMDTFTDLAAGDVLFIDSTHIVKTGGDVQYLFLEVLPQLAPGVIVHVHDVYLPWEYPKEWLQREGRFWNEQYLLQAFLAFNTRFEVLLASCWLHGVARPKLEACLGLEARETNCGSFWMRVAG